MASKASAPIVFLLALNLLFFTLVSSQSPTPMPAPPPSSCNVLNLGVCAQVLGSVALGITVRQSTAAPCCALIGDLAGTNVEVAACLCTRLLSTSSILIETPRVHFKDSNPVMDLEMDDGSCPTPALERDAFEDEYSRPMWRQWSRLF
ncbi:hypothetical protein J1N35_010139 [Gossypium stocksii]|uniref:Hydrophobic seed protein domain-containing protein n=1 Tax=Gossypium stocksii TaxID=47602 RepID=A0A9D3VZD6_9ROSI|nr:hypothetical protein J1N35_010139 [Gossypium stocksii]